MRKARLTKRAVLLPPGADAARLQGRAISPDEPPDGWTLVWSASQQRWVPGSAGSGSVPIIEDLSTQIDGIATVFTTANNYTSGTLEVWVNGMYQGKPPKHFLELTPTTFQFLDFILVVGMELAVRYLPSP